MDSRIFIGTSSWNEKPLIESGRFYPPDVKDSLERLAFYAQRFNLTEVDSTYYALPSRRNTERWAAAVPNGFRFSVKALALFTQHPTRPSSIPKSFHDAMPEEIKEKSRVYYKDVPDEIREEMWLIFRRALQPLRNDGKLGAILIDFPPWFVPSTDNREYLAHAREHLPDDEVIVEFRNRLWVDDEDTAASTFSLLRDLACGFVCVDGPQGLRTSFPPLVAVTGATAAVRFRGRNKAKWEDKAASTEERFNWSYRDAELSEWIPRIRQLADQSERVYVSFSTKGGSQGVDNAVRLQRLLAAT